MRLNLEWFLEGMSLGDPTWTFEEVVTDQCARLPAWAGLGRGGKISGL